MVVIMIFNKQHRGKRELFLQNKVQLKKKPLVETSVISKICHTVHQNKTSY